MIINGCTKEDISDWKAKEKTIRKINVKHRTKKTNQEANWKAPWHSRKAGVAREQP